VNDTQPDTKHKIIEAANNLFYRYGMEGTSIRKIASEAGVNIAAINYHFKSKEHLFIDLFTHNYLWSRNKILKIQKKYPSNTRKFCLEMFKFFRENGPSLVTCFKFLLDDNISSEECLERCKIMPEGPPGHEILREVIKSELKMDLTEKHLGFATKCLSGMIMHKALMLHSKLIKTHINQSGILCQKEMEEGLIFHIEATLNYLKKLNEH